MTTITATDMGRKLSRVLDRLEFAGEEMTIVRNQHVIGRLLPGAPRMSAREALAELFGLLTDAEGAGWLKDSRKLKVTERMRDPWA
jgi:antitoxin (DNA-binding transcriptional repressor) of toxin-antitoxin stability system